MSRRILTGLAAADRVESGLFSGRIPNIRGGSGPKHAVVFFGANALFRNFYELLKDNALLFRRPWYN